MAGHFMLIKKTVAPSPEWVSYFDNTRWTSNQNATWITDRWYFDLTVGTQSVLHVNGSWADGFRPSKVRMTIGGGPYSNDGTFQLENGGEGGIFLVNVANYVSLQEEVIDFSGGEDFFALRLIVTPSPGQTYQITNIEFYGG